jgi:hypothetical protein
MVTTDHGDQGRGRGGRREQTLDAALWAFELSRIVSACSAVSALIVVVRGTDSALVHFRNRSSIFIAVSQRSYDDHEEQKILNLSELAH